MNKVKNDNEESKELLKKHTNRTTQKPKQIKQKVTKKTRLENKMTKSKPICKLLKKKSKVKNLIKYPMTPTDEYNYDPDEYADDQSINTNLMYLCEEPDEMSLDLQPRTRFGIELGHIPPSEAFDYISKTDKRINTIMETRKDIDDFKTSLIELKNSYLEYRSDPYLEKLDFKKLMELADNIRLRDSMRYIEKDQRSATNRARANN